MKTKSLLLLAFLILSTQINAQTFKAGVAIRDITPKELIPISGGMGTPVLPSDFEGKLTVRALVLEKADTKVAIVSIDNIGWLCLFGRPFS